jgi:hypothetical protein
MKILTILAISISLLTSSHAMEKPSFHTKGTPTGSPTGRLKPGEYWWKPHLAPSGPLMVLVSIPEQTMHVYRNGILIGRSSVSTGSTGHATPGGVFSILEKKQEHRSKKYDNAPMPFTQQFTRWGVALHGGIVPGYPTSHGCVHLPRTFARLLYEETSIGTTVVVTNTSPTLSTDHNPPFKISATETGADSTRWPVAQMPEEQDTAR